MSGEPIPPSIMAEIHIRIFMRDRIKRMTWRLQDAGFTKEQIKMIEQIANKEFLEKP